MKSMKKIVTGIVMAVFVCIVLLPFRASAAEEPEIRFAPERDGANVILTLPQSVRENVYSLELSLKIESNAQEKLDVVFLFAEGMAKIAEYRYHEDTGILNLYLSGSEALLKEASVQLGEVSFSAGNEEGVVVQVSIVDDSLRIVSGTRSEPLPGITYPETETIELGKENGSGGDPGQEPGKEPGGDNGSGGDTGETDPMQALREELEKTLALAKTYKKADYTSDSFANLEKAIKAAEEALRNPDALREELETALRNLENAIGALESAAVTPVTSQKSAEQTTKSVKTGDRTEMILWIMVLATSIGVTGVLAGRRIRYR